MIVGHIGKDAKGNTYLKIDGDSCAYNAYLDCEILKIQRVSYTWEVRVKYICNDAEKIYSCFCDALDMDKAIWDEWVYN